MRKILSFATLLCSLVVAHAATLSPIQLLNPAGSSSGQAIVSTGSSTAPAWGSVAATSLAAQSANTVVANATGSSAAPTAYAMPSCSTSSSILQYTSGTGFTCSTTIWASPPAIGGTAAASGAFTTLSSSGAFTPSQTAGIVGTTTNNSANAGAFGEYQSTSTTGTSLPSSTTTNATSISLTAGDWDVDVLAGFNPSGGATMSNIQIGISTTSGTMGALGTRTIFPFTHPAGNPAILPATTVRISLASTTTVYALAFAALSGGTATVDGFIRARRVR